MRNRYMELLAVCTLTLLTATGQAKEAGADKIAPVSGRMFAERAALISRAEIELGQLALEKSADRQVRSFATRMVKEYTRTDAALQDVASSHQIALPTALYADHAKLKRRLEYLQGEEFDREY